EIEHRIDDVLQDLRTGDRAFFRDMSDQKDRNATILPEQEKLVRHFPHLRNRSRSRFDRTRKNCLDRVDDDCPRLQPLNLVDDIFEVRLRKDENVLCFDSEPLATQLDLPLRFFTGDIQHERSPGAESVRHLKQQRALADTGIAPDQYERTGHDAAAEHAIEFSDAGRNADVVLWFDLRERNSRNIAELEAVATAGPTRWLRFFFDE